MELCFSGMWAKGTFGTFQQDSPTQSKDWGSDGCEFMLVFDQGMSSEDNTFLLSDCVAHTPPSVLSKNCGLQEGALRSLPADSLYIFPANWPATLAQDKAAVGGPQAESPYQYTFKMAAMAPTQQTSGGEVRVVDSHNFLAAKNIAAGLVEVKPGGMRDKLEVIPR
jgi:oxalate decarboxylase